MTHILWGYLEAKVGCVFPMAIISILPQAESRPNDNREDAPHFSFTTGSRSHNCGNSSSGNPVESCGKLEVMIPSSFFPQDVSRCLEFVMQISSKFNSRSISRECTFQAIQLKSTDLLLDIVPELIAVYCSKYDCI